MKRRRYPKWVTSYCDRHGRDRLRFRRTGLPVYHFKSAYGTPAFEVEYRQCLGELPLVSAAPKWAAGSVGELVERFYQSTVWASYKPASRSKYGRILDKFVNEHGLRIAARMKAIHVDAILARMMATPAAAADLRKALSRVWGWGKKFGLVPENVIGDVDRIRQRKGGYYTWTDADIETFVAHHGEGSKAWLMLVLAYWTAGRRGEIHDMGWPNVVGGWLYFDREKMDDRHRVPISGALADALAGVPKSQVAFVVKGSGQPYTKESFANLFNDYRRDAGLTRGSLHGLRKAIATRLAESGATDAEGMAILGHSSAQTFAKYRAAAQRGVMAQAGMAKLETGEPVVKGRQTGDVNH